MVLTRTLSCFIAMASGAHPGDAPDNSLTPHDVSAVQLVKRGSDEELPQLMGHAIGGGVEGGCSDHWLGVHACKRCQMPGMRNARTAITKANGSSWKTATFLYLHAQKTGGSTLECATEKNSLQGRWINMGHTNAAAVAHCAEACTFAEQPPKVVVMVRDPYDFWASRFLFAWDCKAAKSCTSYFNIKTFIEFLRFVKRKGARSPWIPQSAIHHNFCGQPCKHDALLHTETMQDDWLTLMDKIGGERTRLPKLVNPSSHAHTPKIEFTSEALDIIHEIDANMFEEWGYTKRHESSSFQLAANLTRLMMPMNDEDSDPADDAS